MHNPEGGSPNPEKPDLDKPTKRLDEIDIEFAKYCTGPSMSAQEHLSALDSPRIALRLRAWHLAELAKSTDPILASKFYEIYENPASETEKALALQALVRLDLSAGLATLVRDLEKLSLTVLETAEEIFKKKRRWLRDEQREALRQLLVRDVEQLVLPETRVRSVLIAICGTSQANDLAPQIFKIAQTAVLPKTIEAAASILDSWPVVSTVTQLSDMLLEKRGAWEERKLIDFCIYLRTKLQDCLVAALRPKLIDKHAEANIEAAFEFIAKSESKVAVSALKNMLGEKDAELRRLAANAIVARYIGSESSQEQEKMVSSIGASLLRLNQLTQDGSLSILEIISSARSYEQLIKCLPNTKEPLRSRIANLVIEIQGALPEKALRLTLDLLCDPRPDLQLVALQILGAERKFDRAQPEWKKYREIILEVVTKFLATPRPAEVVCEASQVFAKLGLKEGVAELTKLRASGSAKKKLFLQEAVGSAIQELRFKRKNNPGSKK